MHSVHYDAELRSRYTAELTIKFDANANGWTITKNDIMSPDARCAAM